MEEQNKRKRCATCVWFVKREATVERNAEGKAVGRCRRYAPSMNGYPVVLESDWCGDHKVNENAAVSTAQQAQR